MQKQVFHLKKNKIKRELKLQFSLLASFKFMNKLSIAYFFSISTYPTEIKLSCSNLNNHLTSVILPFSISKHVIPLG